MTRTRWDPGAVISATLPDGRAYYGRLLTFPWVAFYDLRTPEPVTDIDKVVAEPVLFTLAAHKDLVAPGAWATIGRLPLDGSLRPPSEQFMQDIADPQRCQIIDAEGVIRPATITECKGLEPAAVWEPDHIADRLIDHFADRPNEWLESLRLITD